MNKKSINIDKKFLKKNKKRAITKKSSIENLNNIYIIPQKEIYHTIIINKTSSRFHSKQKKDEKKPSSYFIKNRKALKSTTINYKNQKNKNFKETLFDLLSLSLSGECSNNKKKSKEKKDFAHNTINAINHRFKIYNNTNYNNYIKNDNFIKYKSIDATRTKFRQINNKSNKIRNVGDKSSRKKNRINLKESDNNNIIINFFNAPINKYNKEYYINNFTNNNINNNINKDKKSRKNLFQILNNGNNINNNYNNLNKNIFPLFSYINTGNNNININNINNINDIEFQNNHNKARKRCNTSENLVPLTNNNNIYNSQNRINTGSRSKKNSINKDSNEKYYHNYNKIKEKNKYIKNKKLQSLPPELNIIENILGKVEDKKKKLKKINKKPNNINNVYIINKSIHKINIKNIKHDYLFHSNTINNESTSKNNIYNFLSKVILNIDSKNSKSKSKNKNNKKYLSFNRFMKNDIKETIKDNTKIITIKSIDVIDNKKMTPKFKNLMSKAFRFEKGNKMHKNNIFKDNEKIFYNNNNNNFINKINSQSKKNKDFNTILNNNINILSNRVSHFNISSTKYYNRKKINYKTKKTIETQKRKKINNAIKIKSSQTTSENNIKNDKNIKIEDNLNNLIKNINKNILKTKVIDDINSNIDNLKKKSFNLIDEIEFKQSDPQYAEEYLEEILCNLFLEEKIYLDKIGFQMSSDYLNNYGINPETRTCLIDSLIDLQKIFNFNERTLFITVQLFDRFLTTSIINHLSKIEEEDLDIILTTSLLIASKIEESILYKLTDYLGILSDKYTTNNIIEMEDKILGVINFNVVVPTMLDFFEVFSEKCKLNTIQRNKGLFLLNIVLLDINLSQISASVIAYSIINIINEKDCSFLLKKINLINESNNKNNNKENLDAFFLLNNKDKINELCELINVFSKGILKTEYNHIYKKFDCEKYEYISRKMGDSDINIKDSRNSSYYNS